MKHSIRELKLIDDPLNYVHNLTRIVSYNLSEAGREFLRLFNNDAHCFSGKFLMNLFNSVTRFFVLVLLLWASGELKNYVTLLVRHVFDSTTGLAIIGRCVRMAFEACAEVRNILSFTWVFKKFLFQNAKIGLDLTFELEKLLQPHMTKTIEESRQNLIEAIKLRTSVRKDVYFFLFCVAYF